MLEDDEDWNGHLWLGSDHNCEVVKAQLEAGKLRLTLHSAHCTYEAVLVLVEQKQKVQEGEEDEEGEEEEEEEEED